MAITLTQPQQGQFTQLKKDQPDWSDEDVYAWGQRHYNWGSPDGGSAPSSPASGGGGGATLPPSAPPPSTITAPTSPLAPSPPPPDPNQNLAPSAGASPPPNLSPGYDPNTSPPGFLSIPPPPPAEEADGGSGAGDTVATTNPARTITINGKTITIPGGIDLD